MRGLICLIFIAGLFSLPNKVFSQSLGVFGKTYPILERDMEEYLKEKAANIDHKKVEKDLKRKLEEKLAGGHGMRLPVSAKDRVFYVDPSVELNEDIKDQDGRILVRKGTRINPADYIAMTKTYLFIDATVKKQVDFALSYIENKFGKVTIIITDGDILSLKQKSRYALIYHANSHLIERFAIERTPSILNQEGKLLRVEEKAL